MELFFIYLFFRQFNFFFFNTLLCKSLETLLISVFRFQGARLNAFTHRMRYKYFLSPVHNVIVFILQFFSN